MRAVMQREAEESRRKEMPGAELAMLQRHRNPLDAIADAIRLEVRDRGQDGVRVERLVAMMATIGLNARAVQEGSRT